MDNDANREENKKTTKGDATPSCQTNNRDLRQANAGITDRLERLQNILAKRGIASRRGAAQMIQEGRVKVNHEIITEPGYRVNILDDVVFVDGVLLSEKREKLRTILFYKPAGLICSADSRHGETVCDWAAQYFKERLVPVGRLDKESEGLLLLSNDGTFIECLTHPRYGHEKIYEVEVAGHMLLEKMEKLRSPLEIDGYQIRPVPVRLLLERENHTHILEFKLSEGRNRQIRKMCAIAGFTVLRLRRTKLAFLTLRDLRPGDWRDLKAQEIKMLMTHHPEAKSNE